MAGPPKKTFLPYQNGYCILKILCKTYNCRAMRKEDNSPQGKIVTELLQHLHQVSTGKGPGLLSFRSFVFRSFVYRSFVFGSFVFRSFFFRSFVILVFCLLVLLSLGLLGLLSSVFCLNSLHTCPTCSELPSNITSIGLYV